MSGNPHNVDICVTCICDKPPKLPLREELPSLGIEVVYNARGVGAEATEKETKKERKKLKNQRRKDKGKSTRSGRSALNPPGRSLRKVIQKEDPPEDLGIPKALSYGSYQRTLDIRTKNDTLSLSSSIETTSSMDEKDRVYVRKKKKLAKRLRGLFAKKRNPNDPPESVEFPITQSTLEDAALEEAFNAFMSDEDVNIPVKPSKIELPKKKAGRKKDIFPDLLAGSKDNPEQLEKDDNPKPNDNQIKKVNDSTSSGTDQTTISSLGNESSIYKKNLIFDAEAFSKQARDCLNKLADDHDIVAAKTEEGVNSRGNIKVKLVNNGADEHITEIYDLTEISEAGNEYPQQNDNRNLLSPREHDSSNIFKDDDQDDVVCHGSTAPISPYVENYNDQSQYSEESSVPVPHMHDMFGKLVLDVSDVYEENGPGSPLVLSPVSRREHFSAALSPASFAISDNAQAKKKRSPYLPSFSNNHMRDDSFVQDGRDDIVVYRVESDMSSNFRERNLSPVKLNIASPYQAPTSRAYTSLLDNSRSSRSFGRKMQSYDEIEDYDDRAEMSSRIGPSPESKRVPAIRKSISRDSDDSLKMPKVSFSEDIEERRYYKKEGYTYESSMADVKSSLAAIVNEGQDLTEPLPSALSREADEAFQSLTDQLDGGEKLRTPQQRLLEALSYGDPLPFDFEETIKLNPSIASQQLPEVDTYALHSACLRAFPKRFAKEQTCRVVDLVNDLRLHQKLIDALVAADPETCRHIDLNGDLPVHIMARQLMEWEGQWYQKVYEKANGRDDDQDGGSGITELYKSMSECINSILQPVIEDNTLCLQSGSIGRIFPLHIAAIFTVPYNTLKSLLEAFPNAASIKCDLSGIKTFVPNHSTPLELHDKLSTDFPKWEIQRVTSSPDEEMTQAMVDKIYETTNGIRRSDLMFSFSPGLLPYRKEAYRIRRMEAMIRKEMKEHDKSKNFALTRATEVFWVWLCEFHNDDDPSDNYAESVSRIIDTLSFHSVRFLASILNGEGNPVIDGAITSCADAIIDKLDKIAKTEIPIHVQNLPANSNTLVRSSLLKQVDEDNSKRFRLHGQGFVGPICRTIFNITETTYPSSFVLLPYKLVKDAEGRLGLESSQAARVAMKFAEFLSKLTAPKAIIDTLDQKIAQTLGENLVDEMNRASRESRRKDFDEFLQLYEDQPAYFYFIDDSTGVPIVDEKNGKYPLVVSDAAEIVEKVFPMMLLGMILMRGEKSISILVEILLNDDIKLVLPHWTDAAKDLIAYTVSPHFDSTKSTSEGLLSSREKLLNFVQYGPTENEATTKLDNDGLSTEWVVEMSLIKMIIEMHDPRHYFCDLSQEESTTQILWTRQSDIVNDIQNHIEFKSPKDLKNILRENDKIKSRNEFKDDDSPDGRSYEQNDGNSETRNSHERNYSSGEFTDSTSEDEMPGMIITTRKTRNKEIMEKDVSDQPRDSDCLPRERPESDFNHEVSNFTIDDSNDVDKVINLRLQLDEQENNHEGSNFTANDSYDVDKVINLRVQLDEEENRLNSLRQQISKLDTAGEELEQRENKIASMIDEIIHQRDYLLSPSTDSLEKAKALLRRITELEDRVLCREVEVGQLKNDVSFFELEASDRSNSRRLDEILFSSSHDDAARSSDEHSEPLNEKKESHDESRDEVDEEIQSMESNHVMNFDEVQGFGNGDDTSVGNSTMYNSSIDGYSDGYSAGMSRFD